MAETGITVEELAGSRSGDYQAQERQYVISGTTDDAVARATLLTSVPALTGDNLMIDIYSPRVEPIAGTDSWIGTVRYKKQAAKVGVTTYNFDTGGGTQHITQSLGTVHRYALSGKTAPDLGGAIGVTESSVEGVDVTIPVYRFSETHYLDDSQVTDAYKGALFALTGTVNSGNFKGCAPGECLFLGASGQMREFGDWEITFNFAASPNATGLSVGDISGINKKGWEYLWVRYADRDDTSAQCVVKKPVNVYVEQVYRYGNFGALGIGT